MGRITKGLLVCLALSMFACGFFVILYASGERALEFRISGSFWGFVGGVMILLFFVDNSKKMQLSIFLTALAVPVSWLPLIIFATFQKPPIWAIDAVFYLPFFLFAVLYLKGIDFLREKIGISYITSRKIRLMVGIIWSIINSLIGMLFGVFSVIAGLIGWFVGVSGGQAPEGYVWLSTGTSTPAIGYVLAIGALILGFIVGLVFFHFYGEWADNITLRTLGTSVPTRFGIVMLIAGVVLTIEEMIFGAPLLYHIIRAIPPLM